MNLATAKAAVRRMGVKSIRAICRRPSANVSRECTLIELGQRGFDTFFGYHDVSPFGADDRLLLAMRRKNVGPRRARDPIELGTFDLTTSAPAFEPFATTTAWCWQQGSRLQWYSAPSAQLVLFNTTAGGRHGSCLFDLVRRRVEHKFDRPLYSVTVSGDMGVSLNFSRLQRLRPGYGYDDVADPTEGQLAPDDDGLWLVDLRSGRSELVMSLRAAAALEPEPSMDGAVHYFNHVLWSPSGRHFFFLHLWLTREGRRLTRALTWSVRERACSPLGPRGVVSHHCWVDERRIIVFANEAKAGTGYHMYGIGEGWLRTVGQGLLHEDGHPSMSPAQRELMVTDTYPRMFDEQGLMIFNTASERVEPIASFLSPSAFRGEVRCDLHPRWSRSGQKICVDSAHTGERRLCVIDASSVVVKVAGSSSS